MTPAIILLHGLNSRFPGFMRAAAAAGLAVLAVTPEQSSPRARVLRHLWRTGELTDFAAMRECVVIGRHETDAMVRQTQEWSRRYDLRAVISLTDDYLQLAAIVADLTGIRGPSYRAATLSVDKFLQRAVLTGLSPAYRLVLPAERGEPIPEELTFPLVSKPIGRTGSSGVTALAGPAAVPGQLRSYPHDEAVLLEERVSGPEFSVEHVVVDNRIVLQGVTAKTTNEADTPRFVEVGHQVGPQDREGYEQLRRAAAEAVDHLRIGTGMAHVELRLAPGRGPVLMELTARGGGDAIPTIWELAMGVSLERVLIDAIVTGAVPVPGPVPEVRRWAGQRFLAQHAGRLRAVHCDAEGVTPYWFGSTLRRRPVEPIPADAPAAVHEAMIDVEAGAYLDEVHSSNDRAGSVIAHAPGETELHGIFKVCAEAIRLEIEPTPEAG